MIIWVGLGVLLAIVAALQGWSPVAALFLGVVATAIGAISSSQRRELDGLTERLRALEDAMGERADPVASSEHPPSAIAATVLAPVPATSPAVRTTDAVPGSAASALPASAAATMAGSIDATPSTPPGEDLTARLLRIVGPTGSSREDIEAWVSGRVFAIVGGIALVLGGLFFLSLAFSRGWIGVEARVFIAYLAGAGALAGAAWLFSRGFALLAHVVSAVGLAVISLGLFAATRLYGLVPIDAGLIVSLLVAGGATALAIRHDAQLVALLALASLLGAPPIMGAGPTLSTVLFLGVSLVASAVVALKRGWSWLPALAFLLTAPQVVSFVGAHQPVPLALAALAVYAFLNGVAADGASGASNAWARRAMAILIAANAALLIWGGLTSIGMAGPLVRGGFLAVVGIAHAGLATWSFARRGDHHTFGLLTAGLGVGVLAVSLPVAFTGPPVAVGWAVIAVVLSFLAVWRSHGPGATAALAVGIASVLHVALVEYGPVSPWRAGAYPYVDLAMLTLIVVSLCGVTIGAIVRRASAWIPLASIVLLLLALATYYELPPFGILGVWCALAVTACAVQARIFGRTPARVAALLEGARWDRAATESLLGWSLYASGVILGALGLLQLAAAFAHPVELLNGLAGRGVLPGVPFVDATTLAVVVVAAAAVLAGFAVGHPIAIRAGIVGASSLIAYLLPFELSRSLVAIGWCALAAAGFVAGARDAAGRSLFAIGGSVLTVISVLLVVVAIAPPDRLSVDASPVPTYPLPTIEATGALLACAGTLALGSWLFRGHSAAPRVTFLAGTLVVYWLSVLVVDAFQGMVASSGVALDELQKQAQVALSVLWIVVGAGSFAVGLARRVRGLREAGLVLLVVSIVKVFVLDLAFLDVTYRVLSLIALGALLLVSAFAYQRSRRNEPSRGA